MRKGIKLQKIHLDKMMLFNLLFQNTYNKRDLLNVLLYRMYMKKNLAH